MIVKFLRPASSFKGVGYSFAKMLLDKGELMEVRNFGALEGLTNPRAEDYVNYLEAVTDKNKRIVYPQLHVTISTKGKEHSKSDLTGIAEQWLTGMGYGSHPYLIISHKDTQNNHVHIVSTRIGKDGKKVRDSYERVKAYQVLNEIMGVDESLQVQKDLQQALTYNFSSKAQFMMLLEVKGYNLILKDGNYQIFKFGKKLDSLAVEKVDERITDYQQNKNRIAQLRAIIEKYRSDFNPELFQEKSKLAGGGEGKPTGYNSELAEKLQKDFGLQIFFHAKDGKQPYGYTVIDHAKKAVYKGGDLMPLAEFIKPAPEQFNRPAIDKPAEISDFFELDNLEAPQDYDGESANSYTDDNANYQTEFTGFESPSLYVPPLRIDISDDIDDEQINGRNRKRKRKARTNSR
jgi:hypothetical protein